MTKQNILDSESRKKLHSKITIPALNYFLIREINDRKIIPVSLIDYFKGDPYLVNVAGNINHIYSGLTIDNESLSYTRKDSEHIKNDGVRDSDFIIVDGNYKKGLEFKIKSPNAVMRLAYIITDSNYKGEVRDERIIIETETEDETKKNILQIDKEFVNSDISVKLEKETDRDKGFKILRPERWYKNGCHDFFSGLRYGIKQANMHAKKIYNSPEFSDIAREPGLLY
jgi:hypothetical protein